MIKFTFNAEGLGRDIEAIAATEKQAHAIAWATLTDEQKDRVKCLDLVDQAHAFSHTRGALDEYNKNIGAITQLWAVAETMADVMAAEKAEEDALRPVRLAFYEDTKHINSLENCMLIGLGFMRKCAQLGDSHT